MSGLTSKLRIRTLSDLSFLLCVLCDLGGEKMIGRPQNFVLRVISVVKKNL
jgi:hypothetical protein